MGLDKKSNMFCWPDDFFLSELIETYPSICLQAPKTLGEMYSAAGSYKNGGGAVHSVPSILQSHGFIQTVVADADRYGFLANNFCDNQKMPPENLEFKYIPFPPAHSLKDVPEISLPEIVATINELLRSSIANVFYVAISNIWTIAKYKDPKLTKKTIANVNKKILDIVNKALDAKIRVLIVSDGGMAEDYIDLDTGEVYAKRTSNPLPCILVHKRLEGLKAGAKDIGASEILPLMPTGFASDLAPTILSLMGVVLAKDVQSRVLFADCINQTLK